MSTRCGCLCCMAAASADTVAMPRRLTAENGAKAALIGEFSVTHNTRYGGVVIPIPWTTIKDIYAAAVKHFHPEISP